MVPLKGALECAKGRVAPCSAWAKVGGCWCAGWPTFGNSWRSRSRIPRKARARMAFSILSSPARPFLTSSLACQLPCSIQGGGARESKEAHRADQEAQGGRQRRRGGGCGRGWGAASSGSGGSRRGSANGCRGRSLLSWCHPPPCGLLSCTLSLPLYAYVNLFLSSHCFDVCLPATTHVTVV